jgi:hypothetical protein
MSKAMLTVREWGKTRQVDLDPQGTVIGRSLDCEVVIDSKDVSRRHARVYRDPSGRWFVEDLDSSNGIFVNGKSVGSCPLVLGDVVEIGHASLSLGQLLEHHTEASGSSQMPKIIVEDFGTEVFYDRPRLDKCSTRPCPELLDRASMCLSKSEDLEMLYPELCQILAQGPKAAAVVFRLPSQDSFHPKVLAHYFGSSLEHTMAKIDGSENPPHHALRVSHRLLERVRIEGRALMSKSIFSCDTQVTISLIDEHSPRAIMCVPLGTTDQTMNLVYVDEPINDRIPPQPEEMFAFVQAVAQQICSRD